MYMYNRENVPFSCIKERCSNGLTHVRVISSISDSMEPPHNNSNRNEHNGIKCDCLFKEQCKQSTKQKQDKEVMWMKHESQLEFVVLHVCDILDQ